MRNRALPNRLALVAFVAALAYLVLAPLYRLQAEAFRHGANGYSVAFRAPSIGRTLRYTASLALGSLVIALVLGTALAWSATRLPPRLRSPDDHARGR